MFRTVACLSHVSEAVCACNLAASGKHKLMHQRGSVPNVPHNYAVSAAARCVCTNMASWHVPKQASKQQALQTRTHAHMHIHHIEWICLAQSASVQGAALSHTLQAAATLHLCTTLLAARGAAAAMSQARETTAPV